MTPPAIFKGVVRGSSIDLRLPVGLPDGQEVTVVVRPSDGAGHVDSESSERAARLLAALDAARNENPIGTFTRSDLMIAT